MKLDIEGLSTRFQSCYTVVDGEPALDSFPFMIAGIERRAAKKRAVKTN